MKIFITSLALVVAFTTSSFAEPTKPAQTASAQTRTTKAQSDISSKWSQTLNGIAQNLK